MSSSKDSAHRISSTPGEAHDPAEAITHALTDEANHAGNPTIPHQGADEKRTLCMAGQTFGDYELLSEVGRGGMGVVYKARQKSLDRIVAVKVLSADYSQHSTMLQRFLKEARTVAGLTHPNIVRVIQIGQEGPWHYFVMEFIEGQSLETLTQGRHVPAVWAVNIMIPVAEAVHHAHLSGIIHRDLKPGNIMTDRFHRPIVTDFGIAKSVHKPSSLTQEGTIVGTPAFMSPEQADEDFSRVGPASDVYSLGAVLYKLLTGKPPFDEGTFLKTVMQVVGPNMPPAVQGIRPDVPKVLDQICMKCLSKRPEDRYPSAKALAEDLRHCRATHFAKGESSQGLGKVTKRPSTPAPASGFFLVSEETKKQIRLKQGTTLLGRGKECNVVIKLERVSKRHCRIEIHDDGATIEDLNSANGTAVNGSRVQRSELRDGDSIDIAGNTFTFRAQKARS
jgi:serine/threonine-protein kinase